MQLCGSLNILWHCLSLGLEWKLIFSSPVATAEFSKFAGVLSAALSQHHLSGFVSSMVRIIEAHTRCSVSIHWKDECIYCEWMNQFTICVCPCFYLCMPLQNTNHIYTWISICLMLLTYERTLNHIVKSPKWAQYILLAPSLCQPLSYCCPESMLGLFFQRNLVHCFKAHLYKLMTSSTLTSTSFQTWVPI